MGCFSWLYSDTGKQITNGKHKASYLLVPDEFQLKYGKYIFEDCYNGYGRFGSYDVYELVALWNCKYLNEKSLRQPSRDQYAAGASGDAYYERAVGRYHFNQKMLEEFKNGVDHSAMKVSYGDDYLREIGILIACYDEDNATLKYPLKFVEEPCSYEAAAPSLSDPDHGCL